MPSILLAFCLPRSLFILSQLSKVPAQQLDGQCFVLMLDRP